MYPEKIYYESAALQYDLGKTLAAKYSNVPWIEIENHNKIDELRANPNTAFPQLKKYLIIGIRKTHKYVPNHKVSDYLVPYTSSGCSAMCLYCYLVCHYNKCSYLRLFVNREEMLKKLLKTAAASRDLTFEIGSNSDLVLENTITGNLAWTIEKFATGDRGFITFPTKFAQVSPLLGLEHKGRTIMRMSVNPQSIIHKVEIGTASLKNRIQAMNKMASAGYKVGLLIAPVILVEDWRTQYSRLIEQLADELSEQVKEQLFIEIIFMTYSFVHRAINSEAFPGSMELFDQELMTGRGRGKYCYRLPLRQQGEQFFRTEIAKKLEVPIIYVV
ncbi:MAG: spore photoproduct lyase [Eubacteriales bacterium]|nr:spore photoproduct lyase [Eubacteriales bacterium]MDD3073221.1 spore photoproduct lyase [Eubacteriales bacterium]MDD4078558.1 spore photoproduct lyase [Eubacteriales bacterium]